MKPCVRAAVGIRRSSERFTSAGSDQLKLGSSLARERCTIANPNPIPGQIRLQAASKGQELEVIPAQGRIRPTRVATNSSPVANGAGCCREEQSPSYSRSLLLRARSVPGAAVGKGEPVGVELLGFLLEAGSWPNAQAFTGTRTVVAAGMSQPVMVVA